VLVLVRHGETQANAAGLLLGRSQSPLTERGVAQARALGAVVGLPARVVSSPLARALDTAAAWGLDQVIEVDERWVEVDYGEYEGRALADLGPDVWQAWRADPDYRPPGGETLSEVGRRVRHACHELFAVPGHGARAESDVVVVSHVSPIKAAVAWALGANDTVTWRLQLSTASVTAIGWGHDAPVLHRYNVTVPGPGGRAR